MAENQVGPHSWNPKRRRLAAIVEGKVALLTHAPTGDRLTEKERALIEHIRPGGTAYQLVAIIDRLAPAPTTQEKPHAE